ncbi:uncharacterized protein LOC120390200 isoform X4 [Mauremys reevesii]|uniref:uncharacterized protein LOC120390200 isoform X4 n=1 Tax=Mauremys reevesii TaxID=260615 RepID=UPI00193F929B|nr:uncharacterized protein LOC120390200 isoform X4 [Mauremys reevesii]
MATPTEAPRHDGHGPRDPFSYGKKFKCKSPTPAYRRPGNQERPQLQQAARRPGAWDVAPPSGWGVQTLLPPPLAQDGSKTSAPAPGGDTRGGREGEAPVF